MTSSLRYLTFATCCLDSLAFRFVTFSLGYLVAICYLDNLDFRSMTFTLRYLTFAACCLDNFDFRFVNISLECMTFAVCCLDSFVFRFVTSPLRYMTFATCCLSSSQSRLESNHQSQWKSWELGDNFHPYKIKKLLVYFFINIILSKDIFYFSFFL